MQSSPQTRQGASGYTHMVDAYMNNMTLTPVVIVTGKTQHEPSAPLHDGKPISLQLPVLVSNRQHHEETTAADFQQTDERVERVEPAIPGQVGQSADARRDKQSADRERGCTQTKQSNNQTRKTKTSKSWKPVKKKTARAIPTTKNNSGEADMNNNTKEVECVEARHLKWVAASDDGHQSDEEPRDVRPSPLSRRDSTDMLIEEARQAYVQQCMYHFLTTEPADSQMKLAEPPTSTTDGSDTCSDESRSSCSTFDLSEQTEDSEPRMVVPKLYSRLDNIELILSDRETTPGDADVDKQTDRIPSFVRSHESDRLSLAN